MSESSNEIEKIRSKIREFENEDIYVEVEGALQYNVTIKNAKILISNQKIFITNEKEQDFIIELYYLDFVKIENNSLIMNMLNDIKITLDY